MLDPEFDRKLLRKCFTSTGATLTTSSNIAYFESLILGYITELIFQISKLHVAMALASSFLIINKKYVLVI